MGKITVWHGFVIPLAASIREYDPPMNNPTSHLRAWTELMRVSNVPTVLSNVLTGVALGCGQEPFAWQVWVVTSLAIGFLYVGGMALNDVCDIETDRAERPSRPLPSGRIARQTALIFAVAMFLLAVLAMVVWSVTAGLMAAGLVGLIVCYDLFHRQWTPSYLILGVCRAMIYLLAATATTRPILWPVAGVMAGILNVYTIVISLIARSEADRPLRIAIVQGMLAGICLLDTIFLLFLEQYVPAGVAFLCFPITVLLHRGIRGT